MGRAGARKSEGFQGHLMYRYGKTGKTPVGPLLGPNSMCVKRGIKLQANFLLYSIYCSKDGLASSSNFLGKGK